VARSSAPTGAVFAIQVEDPANQTLEIQVRDSHLTGRPLLGDVSFPLSRLPADGALDAWLPVMDAQPLTAPAKPVGDIHLKFTYKVGCTAVTIALQSFGGCSQELIA
jgi:C2 domain